MYSALIHSGIPVDDNKKIWKMKIPLKLKFFAWYLRKEVILTKDNLFKSNWQGSTKCVFCPQEETIKHFFFQCMIAHSIWSAIQIVSNLYPSRLVANIFGNWLHSVDMKARTIIRVRALAVIWSLWLCRNDKVFNNSNIQMHKFAPFVVHNTTCGKSRPFFEAVFTTEVHDEEYFYPTWMA